MIIAICEDNKQDMNYLHEHLRCAIKTRDIPANFLTFASGEAMLEHMEMNGAAQICFLDILMNGLSGVDLAEWIRERSENTALVFTTSSPDYMANGWRVGAVHYLLKPFSPEQIEQALTRCLKLVGHQKRSVEVTSNRIKRRIMLDQIMYVESQNKYCVIHATNGETTNTLMRLDELENLLADPRFLRCHRSYLANMDKIEKVAGPDFVLTDSMRLPIRRGSRADLVARYEDYYIDKTRGRM